MDIGNIALHPEYPIPRLQAALVLLCRQGCKPIPERFAGQHMVVM